MIPLRELAKNLATRSPGHLAETTASYAVLRARPELLPPSYITRDRAAYFAAVSEHLGGTDVALTFLEFSVYKGDSLRQWCALNRNPDSRFLDFDSFTGLPTRWRNRPAGHFDCAGRFPAIDDPRVRFVPGWFNRTLPTALAELPDSTGTLSVISMRTCTYRRFTA